MTEWVVEMNNLSRQFGQTPAPVDHGMLPVKYLQINLQLL